MGEAKRQRHFQAVTDKVIDRTDHVWFATGWCWKCVLCGGVVIDRPPPYPTPPDWLPRDFRPLTDQERAMCPFECGTRMEGP